MTLILSRIVEKKVHIPVMRKIPQPQRYQRIGLAMIPTSLVLPAPGEIK
jgi:hypothetical protein